MSVAKVKLVSIIGMNESLDEVINFCGKTESFQPDNALSFYSNTQDFKPLSTQDPHSEHIQKLKDLAIDIQKELYVKDTRKLKLSYEEIKAYLEILSAKFSDVLDKRNKINEDIMNYKRQISELEHFENFDLNLNKLFSCKYINIRFGRLPKETYSRLEDYKENPYVMFFVYTTDATHYWGMYCVPKDHAEEVDNVFSSLYFERMRLANVDFTPKAMVEELGEKIIQAQNSLKETESEVDKLWAEEKEKIIEVYSKLNEYSTYSKIRNYGAEYNGKFLIVGWIPKKNQRKFKAGLSKINAIEYDIVKPDEIPKKLPPTLLKNNFFTKPYSFFVNMYGAPNYREFDPTPFVTLTYFMLFGIMFGDVGHGFVLLLVALFLAFKGNALGKILIPCSITSMLWGCVFGSVFGFEHALDPYYERYLGLSEKPVEVMQSSTTNYILYCSAAIGATLLVCAILMNVMVCIKRGRIGKALFSPNGLAGLVFYASLLGGAVLQIVLKIPVFSNMRFIGFAIALPLVLMLFSEVLYDVVEGRGFHKPEDGWGAYIIQSFFELFESALSYLTNTVSFLRIGAYVLVHAGMLLVVSTLAEMFTPWSVGYIAILVLGNIIVIGLEALLVGIQVLRLEFYEMFSRFYDGDGIAFAPVAVERDSKKKIRKLKKAKA